VVRKQAALIRRHEEGETMFHLILTGGAIHMFVLAAFWMSRGR